MIGLKYPLNNQILSFFGKCFLKLFLGYIYGFDIASTSLAAYIPMFAHQFYSYKDPEDYEFSKAVFNDSTKGLILTNSHQVFASNKSAEKLIGSFSDLFNLVPAVKNTPPFLKILLNHETGLYKRDGKLLELSCTSVTIKNKNLILISISDVTYITNEYAKLYSAEKFFQNFSHELKYPLNELSGVLKCHKEQIKPIIADIYKPLQLMYNTFYSFEDVINMKLNQEHKQHLAKIDIKTESKRILSLLELIAQKKAVSLGCKVEKSLKRSIEIDYIRVKECIIAAVKLAINYATYRDKVIITFRPHNDKEILFSIQGKFSNQKSYDLKVLSKIAPLIGSLALKTTESTLSFSFYYTAVVQKLLPNPFEIPTRSKSTVTKPNLLK